MEWLIVSVVLVALGLLGWNTGKPYDMFKNDWNDNAPVIVPLPPTMQPAPEAPNQPSQPVPTPDTVPAPSKGQSLYTVAKSCLGRHMGLDTSVDKSVNCANALTHVLIEAGIHGLPAKGIASTATLYGWFLRSNEFEKVTTALPGDVAIFPTGYGNGTKRGHAFVVGKINPMSNNSKTGLWDAHWNSLEEAIAFYSKQGGIPLSIFRWIG